jgi:SAM-dependent methyltransferase
MADAIFENPALVDIYDEFDGQRDDLIFYLDLAKSLSATQVIDVGCGTGCLATLLIKNGFDVIGLDPAQASLEVASRKPYSEKVRWIHGHASDLPSAVGDLAVMTGNVAQVFLDDSEFNDALLQIRRALKPNGTIAFEARNPAKKAWLGWNKERTYKSIDIASIGNVSGWCQLDQVEGPFVSFTWTYIFQSTGNTICSKSMLRFRSDREIISALRASGFQEPEILDAPDRPGQEFIFVARANPS